MPTFVMVETYKILAYNEAHDAVPAVQELFDMSEESASKEVSNFEIQER